MLLESTPPNISGKSVRTSSRMTTVFSGLRPFGRRDRLGIDRPLQQLPHRIRRLGACLDPVLDTGLVHEHLLASVLVHRIVIAKLFDHFAIARRAAVDRVDAPKRM